MEAAVESAALDIGIAKLKEEQKRTVCSFVSRNNVFASLPMGYGESLCFALLPLVFDHVHEDKGSIVLCISLSTALMMEQHRNFVYEGYHVNMMGRFNRTLKQCTGLDMGWSVCQPQVDIVKPSMEGYAAVSSLPEEHCGFGS